MYLDHFGLDAEPFRITPDTRAFYPGADRGAVLEALVWAVEHGEGIVKVVGEVGAGKTMLCRMLARSLPEHVSVAYVANPGLTPAEIAPAIAGELGVEVPGDDRLGALNALQNHLVEEHGNDRQVVAFIEEAQNMPVETLEELRLLSNLETDDAKLLQIVLFGQPELDAKLEAREIRQLRERITHAFDLRPLRTADAAEYLNFRLRAVGYRGPDLFTRALGRQVNRKAHGLIRRLNVLADKTLMAAFAEGSHTLRPRHVRRAARDLQPPRRAGWSLRRMLGLAASLVVGVLGAVIAWEIWLSDSRADHVLHAEVQERTTMDVAAPEGDGQ